MRHLMQRRPASAVVATASALGASELVVGSVGNVSARDGDVLRITPTRTAYGRLRARDLVTVAVADGALRSRRGVPSQELPLHLAVYRARPDVGAIVHTHSPHATAWSFRGGRLLPETEEVGYYGIGPVRCADYAPPGSDRLAVGAVAALGRSAAVLLGRHGVLAVGPTPQAALTIAQAVEHQAQIAWLLAGRAPGAPAPNLHGARRPGTVQPRADGAR